MFQEVNQIYSDSLNVLTTRIEVLERKQEKQNSALRELSERDSQMQTLQDSLRHQIAALEERQTIAGETAEMREQEAKSAFQEVALSLDRNHNALENRTGWGVGIGLFLLFLVGLLSYLLWRKLNKGGKGIEDLRERQTHLQNEQTRLQEESVKVDNRMLALMEKTLTEKSAAVDHSLVVKLADEIARIETNLSKMDKSVKGYKQLVQAKDRMINNVKAYGYEIISLIGQEYNDGMQFEARFVPDETLPEGTRLITGMIKMQVNYEGKMIQPAQIVVSQNI